MGEEEDHALLSVGIQFRKVAFVADIDKILYRFVGEMPAFLRHRPDKRFVLRCLILRDELEKGIVHQAVVRGFVIIGVEYLDQRLEFSVHKRAENGIEMEERASVKESAGQWDVFLFKSFDDRKGDFCPIELPCTIAMEWMSFSLR